MSRSTRRPVVTLYVLFVFLHVLAAMLAFGTAMLALPSSACSARRSRRISTSRSGSPTRWGPVR